MRIALCKQLVRPENMFSPVNSHTVGFSSMRSYLYANEPDCEVLFTRTPEAVLDAQPDLVGFSSTTEMWHRTEESVCWLRQQGFSGPIIIGGPHVTALPETMPIEADCAVIGEGEQTLLELVRAYRQSRTPDLSGVLGIAYRTGDGAFVRTGGREPLDLDSLPVDLAEDPFACFQISTVRGCPFHCLFCVEHATQGNVRWLSAERLIWLMKKRHRLTGNPHFLFRDDSFLVPRGRLERMHELMAKEDLLGTFTIEMVNLNANLVEDHMVGMLTDIGAINLHVGVESFNPSALKRLKFGVVTVEQVDRVIQQATKVGVAIRGSGVHGVPGETREELIDSIERSQEYDRTTSYRSGAFFLCQPLPGSKLWDRALERGRVSLDMDFSTLRIDADCRYFTSPWFYDNEEKIPRQEFRDILDRYGIRPTGAFEIPGRTDKDQAAKPERTARATREDGDLTFAAAMERLRTCLASRQDKAIAFYGAGKHSSDMLATIPLWKYFSGKGNRLVGFLSDEATEDESLFGHPVLRPEQALSETDTVIISTDVHERMLFKRLREMGFQGEIVTLYSG